MKLHVRIIILGLACWLPAQADDLNPVASGPEGQRAFSDLATIYTKSLSVTFEPPSQILDLNSSDLVKSQEAGLYVLALFEQAFADETNGRTMWKPSPFWNGNSENIARIIRGELAESFGQSASSPAALPAALWLIEHDLVEDNIASGAQVLSRIHGVAADAAIGTILQEQHPSQQVLIMALHEAAARHLVQDKESVIALEQSYRTAVRAAAQTAALALGESRALEYNRAAPLPAPMVVFLKTNTERLLTPVPKNANWQQEEAAPSHLQGWLSKETSFSFTVLDWFAHESYYLKGFSRFHPSTLQDAADELITRRTEIAALQASAVTEDPDGEKSRQKRATLSRYGILSAQAEPNFISLPEITVAIWCWQHGDLDHSRRLLDACYSSAQDDRWIDWAARDYIGNVYHQEMVQQFCDDQYDASALRLATHLSKAVFDDFNYQDRAKELAAQLTRKDIDGDVSLPSLPYWSVLQLFLTRDQQITYLAKRLKLLHVVQDMQPGDVYYDSTMPYSSTGIYCINPYLELKRMSLGSHDFVALAPFAADHDYMRTYSFGRSWFPGRKLHRVSWAVQKLVNDIAGQPAPRTGTIQEYLNGTEPKPKEILSHEGDSPVYFTANPSGDVAQEFRSWAQAQPVRGFWASWWQTPTALLMSFLIIRRYLKRLSFGKLPLKSLIFIFFLLSMMSAIFYPYLGNPVLLSYLSSLANEIAKIFCWVLVVQIVLLLFTKWFRPI